MDRSELKELHYITPIENLPSILEHGLLSHRRAARLQHQTVAMPAVQARRAKVRVPGGRKLHEYVNLYLHARNPMMYKRRSQHTRLCILSVSHHVLDLPGVVVTDRNASSDYVRFAPAPNGLAIVRGDLVFAKSWDHPNQIDKWRHASIKCAEVLVPDRVDTTFVSGAYVSCEATERAVKEVAPDLVTSINPDLFFR
ncbi:MAG: hypothetical protein KatS3mg043_0329 [Rhodothermaceae bacterium]|nr:MAG: hypothetical protein KatS3mg043_0329 [Rhodothermaceae bacterium]